MFPNGMMKFSVIKRIILTTVSIGTIPVKVHKVLGHKIRPKSEGCITIPFRKYAKVVKTVKSSNKPLMLWVYEGMY